MSLPELRKTSARAAAGILLGPCLAVGAPGTEEPPAAPDKSKYTLWNPTPASLMRELSPDRPDRTESAYTLDAGHFQLEMDVVNFAYDNDGGEITRAWNVAPVNVKVGLLNNVDVQLIFGSYVHVQTTTPGGGSDTQSGVADLLTRMKVNFWGNDEGTTAFAALPFVKFPTSSGGLGNDSVEGGVIFPLAIKLPADFDLGMETGIGWLRDDVGDGYHNTFVNSITVGHEIWGPFAGYLEFFSLVSTQGGEAWVGTVDIGFTYGISENLKLDAGVNVGVTSAAPDVSPFCGLTWRF